MRIILAAYLALLSLLVAGASAGGVYVFRDGGSSDLVAETADRYAYDLPRWEMRHLLNKWLFKIGHLFEDGPSDEEGEAILRRYFQLTDDIGAREREVGPSNASADEALLTELEALRQERREIENRVEDILEGRLTSILEEQGLTTCLPLFSDVCLVFPPVDFEFDRPPRVLAISPRHTISLDRAFLLASGLTGPEVLRIEETAESTGVSALVVNIGGVATYPSVVPAVGDYSSTLENVAHEWVHQYLALYPLGRNYFRSEELRTLNETVANIAGRDLAQLYRERYGGPPPPSGPEATFDFAGQMRALRRQVQKLLAEGKIEEAEKLMEEKRADFQAQGVFIRKINQAFFAFHGTYADTAASIDPIGPQLEALRHRSGSVGEFLSVVSKITSRQDLDDLLLERGGLPPIPP